MRGKDVGNLGKFASASSFETKRIYFMCLRIHSAVIEVMRFKVARGLSVGSIELTRLS
jgi:hypothetical protein